MKDNGVSPEPCGREPVTPPSGFRALSGPNPGIVDPDLHPDGLWQGLRKTNHLLWGYRTVSSGLLAAVLLLIAVPVTGQERFPDQLWRPDLLLTLSAGSAVLRADTDMGVPPPPGPSETRSELDRLEHLYAPLRTGPTRSRIAQEAEVSPEELLRAEGHIPHRSGAEPLWDLLELITAETLYFVLREKREHARARPTQVRPRVGTTIPVPGHPAYPSGHAAQAHALAGALSRLSPLCADRYRMTAAGVAYRREIAGVHYPSDTRAGELLAEALIDEIWASGPVRTLLPGAERALAAHVARSGCGPAPDLNGPLGVVR